MFKEVAYLIQSAFDQYNDPNLWDATMILIEVRRINNNSVILVFMPDSNEWE